MGNCLGEFGWFDDRFLACVLAVFVGADVLGCRVIDPGISETVASTFGMDFSI